MKDSAKLLRECETEGRLTLYWMEAARQEAESSRLVGLLSDYQAKHRLLCDRLEKETKLRRKQYIPVRKMGAWMKLHTGLVMRRTDSELARLVSDVCFSHTKSLSRAINHCPNADENIVALTRELILLQQSCTEELREFL